MVRDRSELALIMNSGSDHGVDQSASLRKGSLKYLIDNSDNSGSKPPFESKHNFRGNGKSLFFKKTNQRIEEEKLSHYQCENLEFECRNSVLNLLQVRGKQLSVPHWVCNRKDVMNPTPSFEGAVYFKTHNSF